MTSLASSTVTRLQSSASVRAELDDLLAADPLQVRDFERHAFDRIAGDCRNLVLVGAGGLGRYTLAGLRRLGIEPLAFADNDLRLHGTEVRGVPVFSVEDAVARFNDRATFAVTIWGGSSSPWRYLGISDQLSALGCERHIPAGKLFWKYPETFLPYYCLDLPSKVLAHVGAVRRAFDLMADEASQREFVAQLHWRMRLDFNSLTPPVVEEMYFCDSIVRSIDDETFVDCGAYDGDTLHSFLAHNGDRFERYLAIEPDPINYVGLLSAIADLSPDVALRVDAKVVAVGESRTTLRFDPTGTSSTVIGGSGEAKVECVPLDDLLGDRVPTTIKMDIEGAEPGALRGARRVIAEHAPVLAICVYHAQDHLWAIPNLIHDLNPNYRLYLRPHKGEGWDLVCYAVPPGRLVG